MIWISLRYLECKLYAFSKFTRKLIGVKMKLDMILKWSWDCNHNLFCFFVFFLLGPNLCLQNISCFTWKWMPIKHCRKFVQIKMLGFIYWERVQRPLYPSFQSNQLENKCEIKNLKYAYQDKQKRSWVWIISPRLWWVRCLN